MSDEAVKIPKALDGLGGWFDDRFHGARGFRVLMRKVFPDHWTFMLGEIALWSFVILLLTGTYLALFFVPSAQEVVYHGSYAKLNGISMSQAYASTLNISFDIRGTMSCPGNGPPNKKNARYVPTIGMPCRTPSKIRRPAPDSWSSGSE